MEELKRQQGHDYRQPQRPIGMGTAVVKVACNECALLLVKEAMGLAVGPSQFAVETKGGCALLQSALQMPMEASPNLAAASLDASKAFVENERDCIEAAIQASPCLHSLIPRFEMLYKRGAGELWYCAESGNLVMRTRSRRGVCQGCVLGFFLFCLTMEPVYARLSAAMGEEGSLFTYCDDSYLLAEPNKMAEVLDQAPTIFGRVGLRISFGPGKIKLMLPRSYDMSRFPYPLDRDSYAETRLFPTSPVQFRTTTRTFLPTDPAGNSHRYRSCPSF